jgi:hypothetical protein
VRRFIRQAPGDLPAQAADSVRAYEKPHEINTALGNGRQDTHGRTRFAWC